MTPVFVLWYLGAQGYVYMITVIWKLIVRAWCAMNLSFCPVPYRPVPRYSKEEWTLTLTFFTVCQYCTEYRVCNITVLSV